MTLQRIIFPPCPNYKASQLPDTATPPEPKKKNQMRSHNSLLLHQRMLLWLLCQHPLFCGTLPLFDSAVVDHNPTHNVMHREAMYTTRNLITAQLIIKGEGEGKTLKL